MQAMKEVLVCKHVYFIIHLCGPLHYNLLFSIPKKEKKESLETKANVLLNNSLFDAGCDSFKTK